MPELAFRVESRPMPDLPAARTVYVRGRVTHHEAPEFRESILGEVAGPSAAKLVLELSGVERMDTAGAAVLAEAVKVGRERGVQVLLCRASDSVLRTFSLAGFEEVLGLCCSDEEETRRRLLE